MVKQMDHSGDHGMASNVPDSMMMSFQVDGDVQTEDWVKRQKAEIKELQVKLEASKKDYKKSQAEVESLRLEDPALYRKKVAVLDKVKLQLEKKIDKMNQRIAKVKEIEGKLRQ